MILSIARLRRSVPRGLAGWHITLKTLVLTLLLAGAHYGYCQGSTASIFGTVKDAQGALIPDATVTVNNLDKQKVTTTRTNNDGYYQFPVLLVGRYSLRAEKSDLKTYERTGIVLQVNNKIQADVTMAVGSVNATVTVAESSSMVETQSPTTSTVIDAQRIVDLPLNGRNVADLTLLVPGVQPASTENADSSKQTAQAVFTSAEGSRDSGINYTLDGGENNDDLFNVNLPFPFPDAVQEFSVQTAGQSVDFGQHNGGAVNIVTKGGTNQVHGDVFEFVRNSIFNADNYFSRTPDALKRNQFGGTLGGPLVRNKLFLFGGYQQTITRQTLGSNRARTLPAAFRQGDFSSLLSESSPIVINDPLTGLPFAHNIIPQSRLSPAMQNLLSTQFFPLPDASGYAYFPEYSNQNVYEGVVRADYAINNRNSVFFRYLQNDTENPYTAQGTNLASTGDGSATNAKDGTVGYILTLTPNLVAETHFSFALTPGKRIQSSPGDITALGVNINPQFPSGQIDASLEDTGYDIGTSGRGANFPRSSYNVSNVWHYLHGHHTLNFGGEVSFLRDNTVDFYHTSGEFEFDGEWTGYDVADALLGDMSEFSQGSGDIENRRLRTQSFFADDVWRATPNITLSLGLRWEPYVPMSDAKNGLAAFSESDYQNGIGSSQFPLSPPGLYYPGDRVNGKTAPKSLIHNQLATFSPRIGLAWNVFGDGKTSVRASYGLYHQVPSLWWYNDMENQPPFNTYVELTQNPDGTPLSFDSPYAKVPQLNLFPVATGGSSAQAPFVSPIYADAIDPKPFQIETNQWALSLEHQFANDWLLRVGYVGTETSHLLTVYDLNAPVYNFSESVSINNQTQQQRRPRQQFQQLNFFSSGQNSSYNGLEISLNKRLSRNFSILSAYTFSKSLDENTDDYVNVFNPFNVQFGRGPSDNDHRHRFVTSFLYQLPDPGKAMGSTWLSEVAGGWQATGIVTLQSGTPFSVTAPSTQTGGAGSPFADMTGPVKLSTSRGRQQQIAEYFNTSAVTLPSPGTFGTLGRNSLTGPGVFNTDAALLKSFPLPLRETTLDFRAEAFNLFNRPTLNNPNSSLTGGSFGQITGAGDPRILQFAAKVRF